jgi:hypothetical protein
MRTTHLHDGCNINTRYKRVLPTTIRIYPNACTIPIALGMVEVECTSAWEWFLTTLRYDLNITNISHGTIISDKYKVDFFLIDLSLYNFSIFLPYFFSSQK